jgi:two-component system chemotaxis sensor kinase CheA
MNDLLALFVSEARELLQDAGQDLLVLERASDDATAINRLFRSVHTIKGSSGLFDMPPLTRTLHAAEDMFQAVREHRLSLTPEMVDMALQALDQTGLWIDELDRHEILPADADGVANALVAALRAKFGKRPGEPLAKQETAIAPSLAAPPPGLKDWFSAAALRGAAGCLGDLHLVSYLPDEGCFFKGEDPLAMAMRIPSLQAFGIAPRAPWPALEGFDPFTCNLGFHALSSAAHADVEKLFRYVPDQITITSFAASGLAEETGIVLPPVVVALLREQILLLAIEAPEEESAGRVGSAARTAGNALRHAGLAEPAAAIEAAGALALAAGTNALLSAAIAELLDPAAHFEPMPAELAAPAAAVAVAATPTVATEKLTPRTLRVEQEKIDSMMDLVGELVVAKNSLPFLARRAEKHFGLRELGREIKDQYGVIDRIAQELQGAILAVRMMPVSQVFQRFPRLVRDLARKLGKQVDLVIEGEATEADKNVIETLFDPLLHMIRNSLDHGIETPEIRVAAGKPQTATVRLLARQESDQVVIEIIDDGRGIDPEVIKFKAYEKGLIDQSRLAVISDQEAIMLIFAAGFSTAETLSDVSGRGVGMDVVRNAVEKAGGHIALSSVKGQGTTVRLNLPLSMAVSRVMTVSLGDRMFGIPMDLIHETVKIPRGEIMRIKHAEAFVLRDRVVPLLQLGTLLDLADDLEPADETAVLVVRVAGQTVGLGISAFGEGMEVILKPLEGLLAKIPGYAGTALLGDGRVLLVLDLKELIA